MSELDSPTAESLFRRNRTVLFIFIHLKFELQMNERRKALSADVTDF